MMGDKERGRLFSIQKDGSDSVPFIIKKNKLLIGRGDTCEIRIYVEGVLPEHCIISFNDEGRGFVEPVNKCGYTFLNGEPIERQVSLEHNDVITIVKRSFRFFYPSSSKFFVTSNPETNSEDQDIMDFDPEDAFRRRNQEMLEKRVTFGPRLSPEEFDRNMPPASPLRRGSLPSDKLKAKTPESKTSYFKRALFNSSVSSTPCSAAQQFPGGKELVSSTVVLHKLRCTSYVETQSESNEHEENSSNSRPLFSEVVKKAPANPPKNAANKTFKKYSPKRLAKKPLKIQNSKKTFYKSPRRPIHPRILGLASTGHANSPETIVIYKKRIPPVRNSALSAKKRKSSRHSRGSTNSRKPISEKNNKQDESSESFPANEPFSTGQDVFFHDLSDNEDNNVESENDTHGAERSTFKQKSRQSNVDTSVQRENSNGEQSPLSPLAVAIDSVAQLDENTIDKSLKDIHNAVQALACHSNVPPALSSEPCSSDVCMNAVKKLALTITMVNAFHMYRRIIDDVSGFPLCFPSTSFDSNKDQMKCVQRAGSHQNEDSMDFSNISWFQDIMRNFFPGSFNNDVYDSRRRGMLQSGENDFCPEVTSVRNRKNRRSKFAPKRKVAVKAINSACQNPNCQAFLAEHNAEGFSESHEMHQNHTSAHMNECASCLECTPDKSVYHENSPATSSRQSLSARKSLTENDFELNNSATSSRQSLSLRELFEPNINLNSSERSSKHSLSTRKSSVESSGDLNSPARSVRKSLSAQKSLDKGNKDSKSPAALRQSLSVRKSLRKSNKEFNTPATSLKQSLSARKSLSENDHELNISATSSRQSSSMQESLSQPDIDLNSFERSSRKSMSTQKSLMESSEDLNSPAKLVRKSLSARKSLAKYNKDSKSPATSRQSLSVKKSLRKSNKDFNSPATSLRPSLSARRSFTENDHELNTSETSSRQSSSMQESGSEPDIELNSSERSSRKSLSTQKSLMESSEDLNSPARLVRKSLSARKSLPKGNKDSKSPATSRQSLSVQKSLRKSNKDFNSPATSLRPSLSARISFSENDHELNTSETSSRQSSSMQESLSEPNIDLNSSERSSRKSLSTEKSLMESSEDLNSPARLGRKSLSARKSLPKGNKDSKSPATSRQSLSARKSLPQGNKDSKSPATSRQSLSVQKSLRKSKDFNSPATSLRQSLSARKSLSENDHELNTSETSSKQTSSMQESLSESNIDLNSSETSSKQSLPTQRSLVESSEDLNSPGRLGRKSLSAQKTLAKGNKDLKSPGTSRQSLSPQKSLMLSTKYLNSPARILRPSLSAPKSPAFPRRSLSARKSLATSRQSLLSRVSPVNSRQSLSTNKSPATSRQSLSARKSLAISRQSLSARKSLAISRKSLSARKSLPITRKSLSTRKSLIKSKKDWSSPIRILRHSLSTKNSMALKQSLLVQNSLTESNKDLNSTATSYNKSLSLEKSFAEDSPILHERCSTAKDAQFQELKESINSDICIESSSEKVDETVFDSKQKSPPAQLKKSPIFSFKASNAVTVSPKFVEISISRKTPQHRLTRSKKTSTAVSKPKIISHVSKTQQMTTSKKIKEQKKVQRHRQNVLKKVNFQSMSPKLRIGAPKLIVKLPRISGKETMPKVRLSVKLPSPKVLRKRNEKRKSVVFKSLGVRGKKSIGNSNRRKSLVSIISSKKQVCKNTRAEKDDLLNIAESDNYVENTSTLSDAEKGIELSNKTSSKKTRKGKTGSFEYNEKKPKASVTNIADDLSVKKVSKRGGRKAKNNKANDTLQKKTRGLIRKDDTLGFNDEDNKSPLPTKDNSSKLKTKRGRIKVQDNCQEETQNFVGNSSQSDKTDNLKSITKQGRRKAQDNNQETQINDEVLGTKEAIKKNTSKPNTKRRGRKVLDSGQADPVMDEKDNESSKENVLKDPNRKKVTKSSRKKGSNTEEDIQILENENNNETQINDKGIGKEKSLKNDTSKPKTKRGARKALDSVQVMDEKDNETTNEKALKAPSRKKVTKSSRKKGSDTEEDIQILENENNNEKSRRLRRGKQNIEPKVSSARKGRKKPDVITIADEPEEEADMQNKRRKLDKKDEPKKRVNKKQSDNGKKKNEVLNVCSNSAEESLQSQENDSSKERSVTKGDKRKRGNETTDETPAETDTKSSKQKRRRQKVDLEPSDDVMSEIGAQKKKRKVNLNKEIMPQNPPARGKSGKNSKENAKAKVSHTEVSTRTLRSQR